MSLLFRVVPLGCLLAATVLSLLLGIEWSTRAAAVPWLVAVVAVGLPHGAADLALTRRLCGGPAALRLFVAYAVLMGAVLVGLMTTPSPVVVLFAALSVWHFGLSHAQRQTPAAPAAFRWQAVAAVARGASVLGVPLAARPVATSAVVHHLLSLVGRFETVPPDVFTPAAIRAAGLCLILAAMVALAVETVAFRRVAGCLHRSFDTLVDLLVIGLLGVVADPLFSIGIYFLCWHAWREMVPLMEVLAPSATSDHDRLDAATLVRKLARVHGAALPLLIPTWTALGVGWWFLSPTHSAVDLAILSLVVYLIVTPAHAALHRLLDAAEPVAITWLVVRRNLQTPACKL